MCEWMGHIMISEHHNWQLVTEYNAKMVKYRNICNVYTHRCITQSSERENFQASERKKTLKESLKCGS